MSKITNESFVTLATNDSYCMGALALAQSLKKVNTNRSISIMITSGVSTNVQSLLRNVFDHIEFVNVLDSNDSLNLSLLKRPDLGITFTKFHCWRLIQFTKCVFLDADCLIVKNIDDLFEREEFSASPDIGWPDYFNSGVFVYKPSIQTYSNLIQFAVDFGSFDGGDQGLLNSYFSSWSTGESSKRLPFVYNMTTNISYTYAPAYKQNKDNVKIVHFIGANKPWKRTYNTDNASVEGEGVYEGEHLNLWWSLFSKHCLPSLDEETVRVNLKVKSSSKNNQDHFHVTQNHQQNCEISQGDSHQITHSSNSEQGDSVVIGSEHHENLWKTGKIEYTGRDSFSNIQAHLDSQIEKK